MSHIAGEFTALIGHTPLLDLRRYAQKRGLSAVLLAKLEYLNPAGSVKDRVARALIEDAEKAVSRPGRSSSNPPAATPASAWPPSRLRRATASF